MIVDELLKMIRPDGYRSWLTGLRVETISYGGRLIVVVGESRQAWRTVIQQGRTKKHREVARVSRMDRISAVRSRLQEVLDGR